MKDQSATTISTLRLSNLFGNYPNSFIKEYKHT